MKKLLDEIRIRFGQWWPTVEPAIAVAGILAALMLSGCVLAGAMQAAGKDQMLSPEQIKAYRDVDQDVHGCVQIGGPPPAGNAQFVTVPRGKPGPKFGDGCHILQ